MIRPGSGCMLQDLVNAFGVGALNHGEFVSCVVHLTNDLRDQGILTGRQMGRIQRCAANSDPHPAPAIIRVVRERPQPKAPYIRGRRGTAERRGVALRSELCQLRLCSR